MAVDICPRLCDPPDLDEQFQYKLHWNCSKPSSGDLTCLMTGQEPRTLEIKTKQNKTAYIITMWSFSILSDCQSEAVRQRNWKRLPPATAPPPEHGYLLRKAPWSPKDLTVWLSGGALHRLPSSSSYFKHFPRTWALLPLFAFSKPHLSR